MSEKPFMGNTTQRVDDLGDGSHVPVVKLYGSLSLVQSEDLGTGTKYILKSDGANWLMVRKTYTDTASQLAYASAKNNVGTTLANAWDNRATLTYGAVGDV